MRDENPHDARFPAMHRRPMRILSLMYAKTANLFLGPPLNEIVGARGCQACGSSRQQLLAQRRAILSPNSTACRYSGTEDGPAVLVADLFGKGPTRRLSRHG